MEYHFSNNSHKNILHFNVDPLFGSPHDYIEVVYRGFIHWKKYFNVHFKSQNYSCLLDSHPCLGYRNFCCKKISCNKSKIKAVVLMEKLKQHNLGVKFTPAYFFPCHFDSENKLHWQYSLSIRQYSLSIRQRILLM